jgi:putative membrane protein
MVTPPSALNTDQMGKLDAMKQASVEDLYDLHSDQHSEAHENMLKLMRDFACSDKDAGVPGFASKTAPTVEQHLMAVKGQDASNAGDVTGSPSKS